MTMDDFNLAATTNDLTREQDARDVADFVEFRMDSAKKPITQISEYDGNLPIIATNRTKWFGGKADDSGRLDHLFAAAQFDAVELVDIEVETTRGKRWIVNDFQKNGVKVITSFHGFEETPGQDTLNEIVEECARYGDIAKVATFAREHADVLRMLKAINTATNKGIRVAGLSMGEVGSHTRIVGPLYGSKLGYAPLESDTNEYAPGQIPLHELDSLIEKAENAGENVDIINELEEKSVTTLYGQSD